MNAPDLTSKASLTRRAALKSVLVMGSLMLADATGGEHAGAAADRRRSGSAGREERERDRERHPRRPRRPRISVRYDPAASSVIVNGAKFADSTRIDITVDYDWPYLDYSVPWPIPTASSVDFTNNHGRFTQSVRISPPSGPFTGRVEAVDTIRGMTASKNFSGS